MSSKLRYPKVAGYQLVQEIGGGGFSTVYRAVHFEDHRVAACKVMKLSAETNEQQRKAIDKEIRVHSALKHRNVLEFISAVIVEPTENMPYHPGIYMLLELAAGGDLFDKIAPEIGVGEEVAHYYFTQLISGLSYIHGEGVCHRDLKPENMLLDAAGMLKITDFGLCSVYKLKETGKTRLLTERCGSLPYVAPEVNVTLDTQKPYAAEPIDVWGCGVILFTLLSGNTPWDEPTKRSYEYARYLTGECFDHDPWNRFDHNVLSLITGMLAIDPARRMTLDEVFQHPWMMRPSQIAGKGLAVLAEHLTQSLRQSGDFTIANPNINAGDEDDNMQGPSGGYQSQFTQTLQLFSQTQGRRRYNPHLTRFYASIGRYLLSDLILESLNELGVKWKNPIETEGEVPDEKTLRIRIGGYDKRKVMYKGWIELEYFSWGGKEGTFCVMARDQGNPISWRQLWKSLIISQAVEPHVLRK